MISGPDSEWLRECFVLSKCFHNDNFHGRGKFVSGSKIAPYATQLVLLYEDHCTKITLSQWNERVNSISYIQKLVLPYGVMNCASTTNLNKINYSETSSSTLNSWNIQSNPACTKPTVGRTPMCPIRTECSSWVWDSFFQGPWTQIELRALDILVLSALTMLQSVWVLYVHFEFETLFSFDNVRHNRRSDRTHSLLF